MLKAIGIETHRQLAVVIAVLLLVGISPLGREATHPLVIFLYRSLLFAISILSALDVYQKRQTDVCWRFLAACAAVLVLMLISLLSSPGLHAEGLFRWYQFALFGAGFVALARFHRNQSARLKLVILSAMIVADVLYLSIDFIIARRPVIGPFVNANYFASFLLVGFAGSLAVLSSQNAVLVRAGAALAAAFLYFGVTQAWSRGATISAIAVLAVAILRFARKYSVSWVKVAAVTALLVVVAAASPGLVRKFADLGQQDPYNYMRAQVWLGALKVIGQNPIWGVGLGQFVHVSKQFAPPVEGTVARFLKRPGIAHSEYLQLAAESGIPAALLLITIAAYLVWLAVRRAATCPPESCVFYEAAILTATGIGAHALVDNNWTVPVMASSLVAFSLADVLPVGNPKSAVFLSFSGSRAKRAAAVIVLAGIYTQSTLMTAVGFHFNEAGHQAFVAGDLTTAESLHRIAAGIQPGNTVLLDNTGTVYMELYQQSGSRVHLDFAEMFFTRAAAANPNAEEPRRHMEGVLIQRLTGDVRQDREIHLRMITLDRDILRIDPFNPFVRKNLAEALYHTGMREEAERELARAIEVEPNYVPAYLRIADWYAAAGKTAQSESYRQKAMSVVTKYQNLETREIYEARLLGRPDPRETRP